MKLNQVQQVKTQKLGYGFAQMPYVKASCHINAIYNNQVPRHHIKCVTPMTFSQKMYQLHIGSKPQESADQNYEQALNEVNNLFEQIVSLAE